MRLHGLKGAESAVDGLRSFGWRYNGNGGRTGHGGRILVSNATSALLEGALPADAALRALGEQKEQTDS